jgi:hypothetical protein
VSSSIAGVRPHRPLPSLPQAQVSEQRIRRRVGIAYSLLFLNALTFYPGLSLLPIPSAIGKATAQAALPLALIVALSVNPKVVIRPNVFLCLVSLLVLGALITTLQPQHFGTVYRTFRLAGFVVGLWLLTPWWGRRDLLLVRCHLKVLGVLLGSVLLGLLISPHHARPEGRLTGAFWPVPPPQVAHYSAVMVGLVAVLWLSGKLRGRVTIVIVALGIVALLLTHTRTALVGMIAGILVAGLSLIVAKARVRRLFAIAGAVAAVAIMTLSGVITTWLARGQGTQEIFKLTGRTTVWSALVSFPRNKFQEIFGFGLSNSSFNGLPIDSNWLASYQEQGLYGVTICAVILAFLLITSYFQPRGARRALALFLITYCLLASFTEVGFTDVSAYLLDLTLAASLIVPSAERRGSA